MATASSLKKRSRVAGSGDGYLPMPSPAHIMSSTDIEKEKEYETAVAFLRKFHSTQVAALSQTSRTPLGAISEIGIGDLVNDFSMALQVESPSKLANAGHARHPLSLSRSPQIKKTATSTCLLDLASTSSNSTSSNISSSSSSVDEEDDDSSLFSLHQQARDDIFSDSCSAESDFGVGYYGLNGLGNKRHCSNPIR